MTSSRWERTEATASVRAVRAALVSERHARPLRLGSPFPARKGPKKAVVRAMSTNPEPDVERWEAQLRKGTLQLAILASLWGSRLYGLEILRALEARSNLGLAEGTLYLILNRLRAEGLVEAEWVAADSGHSRKYYWLTP